MSGFDFGFRVEERIQVELAENLAKRIPEFRDHNFDEIGRKASRGQALGALAEYTKMVPLPEISRHLDKELMSLFDRAVLSRGNMIPLAYKDNRLSVAISNPWARAGIDYCRQAFPTAEIVVFLTFQNEISGVLEDTITAREVNFSNMEVVTSEDINTPAEFDLSNEFPDDIHEQIRQFLIEGIKVGASDIHINVEQSLGNFYYQYRIDGDCTAKMELPFNLRGKLDAYLMVKAGLPIEAKRSPQSGRFTVSIESRKVDARYERTPTYGEYKLTIRLLDKSKTDFTLGQGAMNFPPNVMMQIRSMLEAPSGLTLVSGPTGSGKSSTISAFLKAINLDKYQIYSIENPVEHVIPGVIHIQIDPMDDPEGFTETIRSINRGDPCVINIGEIRDKMTALAAIEAAVAGTQVFSTIHTANAGLIFQRLKGFGIPMDAVAPVLKYACAQRLVRTLCRTCAEDVVYSAEDVAFYRLPKDWTGETFKTKHDNGCLDCNHSGYKGRLALFEILPINTDMAKELIEKELQPLGLQARIKKELDLPSLRDMALEAIKNKQSDLSAVRDAVNLFE